MDPTLLYACVIVILTVLSAFFSLTETAFTSANRVRLKRMANDGDRRAGRTLDMLEDYDRFITTNLIGVNIVNIASTTVASLMFVLLFAELGSIVNIVVMTLVSLTFCEIIPKTVAKKSPEKWCLKTCSVFSVIERLFFPISWLFTKLTRAIGESDDPVMSDEELEVLIDECEDGGSLKSNESEMIKSAIRFDDIRVSELCVPRVDVTAVSKEATGDELGDVFTETGFTRIPVYDGDIDNIVGMANAKEYLRRLHDDLPRGAADVMVPVRYVPETMSASVMLDDFRRSKVHMAVVLDSFGGTLGIVTLEDLIEELVGDIWDESDEIREDIVPSDDGTYRIRGGADIHEAMESIGGTFDPEGYGDWSVTGYVFHRMGRTPRVGDVVESGNVSITVLSMDGRRVGECSVSVTPLEDDTTG